MFYFLILSIEWWTNVIGTTKGLRCDLLNFLPRQGFSNAYLNRWGMGPLFVLVFPCFREMYSCHMQNWVFLCSLDDLLQKKRNCFLCWKSNFKLALIWKKGYFWPIFHIFSYQGIVTKNPSAHIWLTYMHVFCSLYWLYLPYQFWKKKYEFIRYGFSLVWFLVLILIRAILEKWINNKMVSKI